MRRFSLRRNSQGKSQPKSAAPKPTTNGTATRGGRVGGRGARRGRNAGRPKAKTADELDAEMVDYFDANAANGTVATTDAAAAINGAAAPATNGEEIGMDEISVSVTRGSKLRIANQCCSELPKTKGRSSNDITGEINC